MAGTPAGPAVDEISGHDARTCHLGDGRSNGASAAATRRSYSPQLLAAATRRSYSPQLLAEERRRAAALDRSCLFISHRQADLASAMRTAYLACREGFDFWLDVFDPDLQTLPQGNTNPKVRAIAIAGAIEIALLNSTHVIAVVTPRTKGSAWVPYEYGRVKTPTVASAQAASWVSDDADLAELPDYLFLGPLTRSEADISVWLRTQLAEFGRHPSLGNRWTYPVPAPI